MSDHIIRKGATYYYRRRVPSDLVAAYGKSEYVRSLRTTNKRTAEVMGRKVDVEIDELFHNLRNPVHPATRVLSTETPEHRRAREEYEQDDAEWREEQWRNSEQDDADTAAYWAAREERVQELAEAFSRVVGISHSPATPPVSSHRTQPAAKPSQPADGPVRRSLTPTDGQYLHAILRLWAAEKKPVIQTVHTAELAANRFRELMGDVPIPNITKVNIVEFKDKLALAGHSANTINKTLNYMRIMFNHAISQAWIDIDPAKGIKVSIKKKDAKSARPPFKESTLNAIFAHPIYSQGIRPEGGAGDAAYWLPLLGLFTGARIEELCQLSPSDVYQEKYRDSKGREQTVWVMHITGTGEGQGVKTAGSDRRIPIHKEILDRGFIKYVSDQKGERRLFPLLKPDIYGHDAPRWSVWWHKVMRKDGAIPADGSVFHSYRHNYKDTCRECGISKEVSDALQGHVEGDSSGDYGAKLYPLRPMVEAVSRFKVHGVTLPAVP